MAIDWDALDNIEMAQRHIHAAVFSGLSKIYVPGEGDIPRAIVIGEAPGAHEEMQCRPFVGPAGQVLRQLMELANLGTGVASGPDGTEGNCWLTNTIKFRPPGNRKPTDEEVRAARPYLREEWIAVGKPRVVVLVGGVALYAITGKPQSILRAAGKMHKATSSTDGKPLYVWPMVHPSFAMRNPVVQSVIEDDWERLGEWLAENTH